MQSLVPELLNFVQKADHGVEIRGVWPLQRMPRFAEMLHNAEGQVEVDLRFGRHGKLRVVQGALKADLAVLCQRCMQAMSYPLHTQLNLALIKDDAQAEALPEEFEPLLLEADDLNLPAMLEEELLLALPLVLMHEHDCSDYLQQQAEQQKQDAAVAAEQKAKTSPFAVLKAFAVLKDLGKK